LPVLGWQHATGEWWGLREALAARGLELEAVHTWDLFSVVSGGLHRKLESLGNLDLQLKVDLEKLAEWTGASLQVYGLGDYGGNPSKNSGDAQVHDNIESPDTWKLYGAWFQQELVSGKLSLLAGLYDLNSEFDVSPAALLFINSSHGIGADFAQSGLNGPSIFPTTSLAGRIKVSPWESFYAQVAVLDGVPGDPEDPRGTQVILDRDDGVLVVSEVALLELQEVELESPVHRIRPGRGTEEIAGESERYTGKLAAGAWVYSAEFDVLGSSGPDRERGNHGVYILGSRKLYREPESWFEGLYAFLRAGYADSRFNPFGFYTGAGAVYLGLIPGRDGDATGLAVAAAYNGGRWSDVLKDEGSDPDVAEVSLELTYRAQVIGWAVLQGDIQYIFNPGADGTIDDALVLGLRTEIIF
jgi:porin